MTSGEKRVGLLEFQHLNLLFSEEKKVLQDEAPAAPRIVPPEADRPLPHPSSYATGMSDASVADTRRLNSKPQDLTDAYGPPSNFLEIDIFNPQTVGVGRNRYTVYEVRMRTNLPIFKLKDSTVRRRYSDFEWLKNELERDSKIVVPPLPGKALKRQLPFRGDEGIFEESFIEERRQGLEQFINKIAGHPLAQNERCLHMFLQDETIDRNYVPGKVRQLKWIALEPKNSRVNKHF
ncbi:unnamed protein product [Ranitomeya imitator]|uniref:PX domain-containing protein n=2 Tax=Ranitomeya imitator TaxID=111125 RepID=A0ABN9M486_9NEOB|nr:unnamed protein product [Ranitomeya imitator]